MPRSRARPSIRAVARPLFLAALAALLLAALVTAAVAKATPPQSNPPVEQNPERIWSFSNVLGDYLTGIVAIGASPSPYAPFTATGIEKERDVTLVTFRRDDGRGLTLSFAFPYRCTDCVRGRLFAISWPGPDREARELARAIVDRSVALDVESTVASSPPTLTGHLSAAVVTVAIYLDAAGVRVREVVWQVASAIASATSWGEATWRAMFDRLDARGAWSHDTAELLMLMVLWKLGALLLLLETVRAVRCLDAQLRWAILAVVVGSFALRRLLATDGPGDLHVNLLMSDYGLAPAALLGLLSVFAAISPGVAIGVATVFGSLAPAYGSLLSYALRRERRTAIATGALLALQPVLVRFSGDCERQSYVIFLAVVALWGLARYYQSRSWVGLALNVVALQLCFTSRPEAVFAIAFSFLLVWPGNRFSPTAALAQVLAGVLAFIVTIRGRHLIEHGSVMAAVPGGVLPGPETSIWMSPEYTSLVVIGLGGLGLLFTIARRQRDGLWAALCLAIPTMIVRGSIADGWVANARYQTLAVLPFSLLAALGLECVHRAAARFVTTRWVTAGVWCAIVVSSLPPLHRVTLPRTIDYEFRFLQTVLAGLPRDAVIYCAKDDEADVDMKKFQVLSTFLGFPDQQWRVWKGEPLVADRPTYFFLQPYCQVKPAEWQHRQDRGVSARETSAGFNSCREAARCGSQVAGAVIPARRFSLDEFTEPEVQIAMLGFPGGACPTAAH